MRTLSGKLRRSPLGRTSSLLYKTLRKMSSGIYSLQNYSHIPVEILNPLRINVAVKCNPMLFTTTILRRICMEKTIVPLTRSPIASARQSVFVYDFRIDDVGYSFEPSTRSDRQMVQGVVWKIGRRKGFPSRENPLHGGLALTQVCIQSPRVSFSTSSLHTCFPSRSPISSTFSVSHRSA
jgi:hypothetical protein